MSIYKFEYTSLEGKRKSLNDYKGKVLLIVNTASKCGFTPQYEGLQELYQKYHDKGFEIIGFPCNQFKEQEPGDAKDISEFCSVRYGVTFPLSQKIDVREENADPLFKYLTKEKGFKGLGRGIKTKSFELMLKALYKDKFDDDQIKWNFTKFLIDKEGNVVERFEPTIEPLEFEEDIKRLL
ncbi:MAG: glutathione peroxidase [Erysipelotrichaceae bacterium]|nr:glutathione peroxidase [Erysipelotrichaceae bacterium]MDD3924381.1 glutathione peroxidase [Erysipelotrichaceae bacterium]